MRSTATASLAGAAVLLGFVVSARSAQDPAQDLKNVLKDTAVHASWIYNDLPAGLAEAKKSGKPLLVVFR